MKIKRLCSIILLILYTSLAVKIDFYDIAFAPEREQSHSMLATIVEEDISQLYSNNTITVKKNQIADLFNSINLNFRAINYKTGFECLKNYHLDHNVHYNIPLISLKHPIRAYTSEGGS